MAQESKRKEHDREVESANTSTRECDVDELYNGMQIYYCTLIICFDKAIQYQKTHITDSMSLPHDRITDMHETEISALIKSYINASKGYINRSIYFYSMQPLDNMDEQIKQIRNTLSKYLYPSEDVSKSAQYFKLIANGYNEFQQRFPFLCSINAGNDDETKTKDIEITEYPNQIICDQLYLGDIHHAYNEKILSDLTITHIINCSHLIRNKFENNKKMHIKYLKIKVGDADASDIAKYFDVTARFISNALDKEQHNRVFIHCHAGVSRSSTITIAYLMRSKCMRFKEAFDFVKQKRPFIEPNTSFIKQLKQFEKNIFSNTNPFK